MSSYNKKCVEDIDVTGKKVIVRVDFNVPLNAEGQITDDKRIVAALPTIKYLVDHKAKVILVSHMGKPKGEYNPKYSMAPASKRLGELYGSETAEKVRIQYGGSVNAETAEGLFRMPDIDGGLVGGASLKVKDCTIIAGDRS